MSGLRFPHTCQVKERKTKEKGIEGCLLPKFGKEKKGWRRFPIYWAANSVSVNFRFRKKKREIEINRIDLPRYPLNSLPKIKSRVFTYLSESFSFPIYLPDIFFFFFVYGKKMSIESSLLKHPLILHQKVISFWHHEIYEWRYIVKFLTIDFNLNHLIFKPFKLNR